MTPQQPREDDAHSSSDDDEEGTAFSDYVALDDAARRRPREARPDAWTAPVLDDPAGGPGVFSRGASGDTPHKEANENVRYAATNGLGPRASNASAFPDLRACLRCESATLELVELGVENP